MATVNREPTLQEVLRLVMQAHDVGLYVGLPAQVESYDPDRGCVDVKPLIKRRERNGQLSSLPVIRRVPVQFQGGAGFRMIFPLAKGDVVQLIFNDQAIDAWKEKGGEQDPGVVRTHDLADATALPSIRPLTSPWTDAPTDSMKIGKDGGDAQIELKESEIVLAGGSKDAAGKGHKVKCGTLAAAYTGGTVELTYTPPSGGPPTVGSSVTLEGLIDEGNSKVKV